MKTTKMLTILVLAMGLMAWLAKVSEAAPLGTAFMYQGLLIDGTEVLDGSYDLMVSLFDDPNEGELRGTVFVDDLDVNDGWFEIMLDFGDGVFDGSARWLETAVRPGELEDPNEYVILLPRREVTPTPYALYAKTAGAAQTLRAADGSPTATVYVHSEGNVGIGTTEPTEKLEVNGNIKVDNIRMGNSDIIDNESLRIIIDSDANQTDQTFSVWNDGSVGKELFRIQEDGKVGIGTIAPVAKLDVAGDIAVNGSQIINSSGQWVGDPTGLQGPPGPQGPQGDPGAGLEPPVTFIFESSVPVISCHNNGTGEGLYGISNGFGVYGERFGTGNYGYLGGLRGAYGEHGGTGNFGYLGGRKYGVYGYSRGDPGVLGTTNGSDADGVHGLHQVTFNYGALGNPQYGAKGKHATMGNKGMLGTWTAGVESYGAAGSYDFYATGPGEDYGSASSIRWKSDVRAIDDPLGKVLSLRGVYFNWDAEHGGHHDVGMIAEEVGHVLPEIVVYEEDGIYATGMDYSKLTPLLVEAIKGLKAENDALKQKLDALEAKMEQYQPTAAKEVYDGIK